MSVTGESDSSSIYEFVVTDIDGNPVKLDRYAGKVCLIVNVASRWGYTDQYAQLQALHGRYAKDGLAVLAFPCNQFAAEEPGTDQEIKKFAVSEFGVEFDMFSKIEVNGSGTAPLYNYLKKCHHGSDIKWNFAKFLVDKNGIPVKIYDPEVEPNAIVDDIKHYLLL